MPHLRSLVERHKDDPFTILGVNTNDAPDVYRDGLDEHEVSWPAIYQGKDSFIARLYGVSGYPTYVLVDADGKIVSVGHNGRLDKKIATLVADAKSRKGGGKKEPGSKEGVGAGL